MPKVRLVALVGALAAAWFGCPSANAQSTDEPRTIKLARLVNPPAAAAAYHADPLGLNPLGMFALRGGAMLSPRGAGLVGVDATLPGFGFGFGFSTRIDVDIIFKANFGGLNTIIPVTVDQIFRSPTVSGKSVYVGGGVGAVLGGPAKFDGKLILGADLLNKLAGELNVHVSDRETLFTILARLHM